MDQAAPVGSADPGTRDRPGRPAAGTTDAPSTDGSEQGAALSGRGLSRFAPQLMYAAARMYYLQDATQAEVAAKLGLSRATVSRVLSEARRAGIVRIEVMPPPRQDDAVAEELAAALGLARVHLASVPPRMAPGAALAPALSAALTEVNLAPGEVLLVASGRTIYEAAQAELPRLPGVQVVPTVGGQDEPEPWYQANEIARQVAAKIGGSPVFLYAPALPGPELYERLVHDPAIRRVFDLWEMARCAVLGIGAPTLRRPSLPNFVPTDAGRLAESVGDVCYRFYDSAGQPLPWPGSERLIATGLQTLRHVPVRIAAAVGAEKVPGIVAGSRAGHFTVLVTDPPTAAAVLATL